MGASGRMTALTPAERRTLPSAQPTAAQRGTAATPRLGWPPSARLAVPLFLLLALLLAWRVLDGSVIEGQPQLERWGLIDFRDAVYYPARAFLNGDNPYDVGPYSQRYPIGWGFPLYSPITLLLYAPIALADFSTAAGAFLIGNLLLVPVLCFLALRLNRLPAPAGAVFGLAAAALLTRGAYVTLTLGQSTIYVTVALYAALYLARRRPWAAAMALAVASLKPTFAVPVAWLMLMRGDHAAVLRGGMLAVIAALLPLAWLAIVSGGPSSLAEILLDNNRYMRTLGDVHAAMAPLRVDALAVLARLSPAAALPASETAMTLGMLAAGALLVRRLRDQRAAEPLVLTVIVCVALLCTYHQVYDVCLLIAPVAGLLLTDWVVALGGTRRQRWLLVALLSTPLLNYAMSRGGLQWLGQPQGIGSLVNAPPWVMMLASVNGVALIAALLLCSRLAMRVERPA
jgi:hypothetical protein